MHIATMHNARHVQRNEQAMGSEPQRQCTNQQSAKLLRLRII